MSDSLTHSQLDAFYRTLLDNKPDPENSLGQFNPLAILPPDATADLKKLWKQNNFHLNEAGMAYLEARSHLLDTLGRAGLLPKYYLYALEYVFMRTK